MARLITLTPNPALDFAFETEKIEPNRKLRCSSPRVDPGGGGINVSRAARRLGADTLAIFTAGGVYGEALKKAVAQENVSARITPVSSETRPAFHARETSTGNEYRFNFPGEAMNENEARALLDALSEETDAGDFVVGSGSLPRHAPTDFWARAARIAKSKEACFALDTSRGLEAALAEGVYLLRLNKIDAATLAGRPLAWPDGAADFAKSLIAGGGAELIVMTHGGTGGLLARADRVCFADAPKVEIVSAVGAGDSFVGALVVALMEGKTDQEALRYGFAASAATLKTAGTMLFDADDMRQIYESANAQSR